MKLKNDVLFLSVCVWHSLDTLTYIKNTGLKIDHFNLSSRKSTTFDIFILAVCEKFVTLDLVKRPTPPGVSYRSVVKHPLNYSEGRTFDCYWEHSEFLFSKYACFCLSLDTSSFTNIDILKRCSSSGNISETRYFHDEKHVSLQETAKFINRIPFCTRQNWRCKRIGAVRIFQFLHF